MTAASKRQRLLRLATRDALRLRHVLREFSNREFAEHYPGFDALIRHADWTAIQGKGVQNNGNRSDGTFDWFACHHPEETADRDRLSSM